MAETTGPAPFSLRNPPRFRSQRTCSVAAKSFSYAPCQPAPRCRHCDAWL